MPIARINALDVYYEDTGGTGPVLVFSHGFLMDHEMFAPQIAASMRAFDAVAATEDAYLDNVARRLEDYYRRNAAAIDSATTYPVVLESLCAGSD